MSGRDGSRQAPRSPSPGSFEEEGLTQASSASTATNTATNQHGHHRREGHPHWEAFWGGQKLPLKFIEALSDKDFWKSLNLEERQMWHEDLAYQVWIEEQFGRGKGWPYQEHIRELKPRTPDDAPLVKANHELLLAGFQVAEPPF